jgi:peptidoglycan-N-acetylglucosamine deacetylase
MSNATRPLASISLDLDDLWTYMRIHGDSRWSTRPSYLGSVVPLALDALDRAGIKLTFFVVGADAAQPVNAPLLRRIVDQGHEIGNHSFEHEPWLHRLSPADLEAEVVRTQDTIAQVTGAKPVGFRGPGYSWCPGLLEILVEQGYLYDASTLPTYLGPLARRYYFWTSRLTPEERAVRSSLFGNFQDGLRPVKSYLWQLSAGRTLLEIPVTTFPLLKVPFHFSYLNYLSRWSEPLAIGYLRTALAACRLGGTSPSFILHPLDIVGGEQVPELAFFPAMDRPSARKIALFARVMSIYKESFALVPMSLHARAVMSGAPLAVRRPGALRAQAPGLERERQCAAS